MSGRPWLSVVLPTYNGAAYLRQTLDSIGAQGDDGLEVIVVDDGSTDETPAIARSYEDRLPLRLVVQDHGGNWVASTNAGLAMATGTFLSLLHQDDTWAPGRLAVLRAALGELADPRLVIHQVHFIDAAGRRVGRLRAPLAPRVAVPPAQMVEHLLVQNFISLPAALVRLDDVVGVGGLDEGLVYTADWDLWLKLAALGPSYYLPLPLASFRVHPAAQTTLLSGRSAEFNRQLDAVLERHLTLWRPEMGGADVERAARFSVGANVALGAALHGDVAVLGRLARDFARLGPAGGLRYLRDSRVVERTGARVRGRTWRPPIS